MSTEWTRYFDPEKLAALKGHRLRAFSRLHNSMAGAHRSNQTGQSVEFSQHREYVPGDDVRQIDWKVYARTDKYYLRQHEDETNLSCYIVLDCSESMMFASDERTINKLEFAKQLAAAVAFLVTENQDSAGLMTASDQVITSVPLSSQRGLLAIIGQLLCETQGSGKTNTLNVMSAVADRSPRRGLVVFVSDLLDSAEHIESGLARLKHDGFEAIMLHVIDPAERDFTFEGPMRFKGLEAMGSLELEASGIRAAYREEFALHVQRIKTACQRNDFDYESFVTSDSMSVQLSQFLARREVRMR